MAMYILTASMKDLIRTILRNDCLFFGGLIFVLVAVAADRICVANSWKADIVP